MLALIGAVAVTLVIILGLNSIITFLRNTLKDHDNAR